jgi:hypothetical protein
MLKMVRVAIALLLSLLLLPSVAHAEARIALPAKARRVDRHIRFNELRQDFKELFTMRRVI